MNKPIQKTKSSINSLNLTPLELLELELEQVNNEIFLLNEKKTFIVNQIKNLTKQDVTNGLKMIVNLYEQGKFNDVEYEEILNDDGSKRIIFNGSTIKSLQQSEDLEEYVFHLTVTHFNTRILYTFKYNTSKINKETNTVHCTYEIST